MKMKKVDLEKLVSELQKELTQKQNIYELKVMSLEKERDDAVRALEEEAYKNWCASNGKFLELYIKENIAQKFSISTDTSWGGSYEVTLKYEDEFISSDSDSIISHNNPEEK